MSVDLDRALLRSLLHAPQALAMIRARVSPADFLDHDCASLARRLWAGLSPAGALAHELTAQPTPPSFDWIAEACAAAYGMMNRRLKARLAGYREALARVGVGPESDAIIREVDTTARELRALSIEREAARPVLVPHAVPGTTPPTPSPPAPAAWERSYPGGVAHYFSPSAENARCSVGPRSGAPAPAGVRTCRRCVGLLAGDLVRASFEGGGVS